MKKTKKFLKAVWKVLVFLYHYPDKAKREAVDAGIVDYSGQGRNKYGF